ncbi:M15 family metallopeptidase [Paenibacillus rhizophilus]|uniref:M15 family peptidase n=1 Tax=Paenibacillus rhizophilus TaxID=1850366 RepID=A0A3N9Q2V9_9BACL|nr:M15 family metallopeptidase [Paenibacillus rhizophilus]RQW11856.1 M15 family peptidase [Paenibacillus rhizophilus]
MTLTLDQVKAKSAPKLVGLQPVVLAGVTALIERCYNRGVMIVITQGLRTYAEQDGLYAKGRTAPGEIVTNARGGYSNHNFGLAVDFALLLLDGRTISWDMQRDDDGDKTTDWMEVVQEAKALGFAWGGDWKKFKDYPHLEMVFGLSTAQLHAGERPSAVAVNAAFAKIAKLQEEAYEMTEVEKKDFEDLKATVKEQAKLIEELTSSKDTLKEETLKQAAEIKELGEALLELTDTTPPKWAEAALQAFANTPSALNGKPVLDTPDKATYTEARLITILHRLGLAARQKGDK